MRTRLNRFTEQEQCELINWGYAVCDAALRRHVEPSSIPPQWPYPRFALE
jgi:NTE family protein